MIRTKNVTDVRELDAALEKLRAQGVSDEVLAAYSATMSDLAVTEGNTQEELNDLRAKIHETARFELVRWIVIHGRVDLDEEAKT